MKSVFPRVDQELTAWSARASGADPRIMEQALASIRHKRFHCLGGAVFSLWPGLRPERREGLLRLIVAFQTISDYLDNLCDRMNVVEPEAFLRLHSSMLAALDTAVAPSLCYGFFPVRQDAGYLDRLVRQCRAETRSLPNYALVREQAAALTQLYIDLQVHKHAFGTERTRRLSTWYGQHESMAPECFWWEFAAACGSTLGVFALFALAAQERLSESEVGRVKDAYFPYICGLHILLDYYIDEDEDEENHDLNLVSFYGGDRATRLALFVDGALQRARELDHPEFHITVVLGLLALYLSDPKAGGRLRAETRKLVTQGGGVAEMMTGLCRRLRDGGRI